ncbi:dihydroneopterin aldolase [Sphingomonas sp.]|uniref:dihydroneopterin aldolase n=1 Tax=Sphingomonas sp. TaxID=28214 RepID=UPI0031E38E4B
MARIISGDAIAADLGRRTAERRAARCKTPSRPRRTPMRACESTLTIGITALEVLADIGIEPDEIGRRQPLRLDVSLGLASEAGATLANTIDYRRIAALADELAEERVELIETFARRLAEGCLAWPFVVTATVMVEKPRALHRGIARAEVSLVAR